jgi:hypothetical protein
MDNTTLHADWNSTIPIKTKIMDADYLIELLCAVMKCAKEDLECTIEPSGCSDLKDGQCRSCYECKTTAEAYFKSVLFQHTLNMLGVNMPAGEYIRKRTNLDIGE